jgi:hypothetical protein
MHSRPAHSSLDNRGCAAPELPLYRPMKRRHGIEFNLGKAMVLAVWIALGFAAIHETWSAPRASLDTPSWGRSPNMVPPSSPPARFTA